MALMKRDCEKISDGFQEQLRAMDYEVQFYEVSSYSTLVGLKNFITRVMHRQIVNVENCILKRSDPSEHDESREIMKRLEKRFELAVEKCCNKIEPKFFAVFNIPSHLLLPEDKNQSEQFTENDIKEIDDEIEKLRKKYKRAICMEAFLRKEKQQCSNLDIMEKKVMELEDSVNALSSLYESKKKWWNETTNILLDMKSLQEQIKTITN